MVSVVDIVIGFGVLFGLLWGVYVDERIIICIFVGKIKFGNVLWLWLDYGWGWKMLVFMLFIRWIVVWIDYEEMEKV